MWGAYIFAGLTEECTCWCTGLNENAKGDVDGDGTADLWRVTYHKQLRGVTTINKVTWGAKRHLLAVAETVPNSSKVRRVCNQRVGDEWAGGSWTGGWYTSVATYCTKMDLRRKRA